jgi:hypothetical protein
LGINSVGSERVSTYLVRNFVLNSVYCRFNIGGGTKFSPEDRTGSPLGFASTMLKSTTCGASRHHGTRGEGLKRGGTEKEGNDRRRKGWKRGGMLYCTPPVTCGASTKR